jgi:hypothetical protein
MRMAVTICLSVKSLNSFVELVAVGICARLEVLDERLELSGIVVGVGERLQKF